MGALSIWEEKPAHEFWDAHLTGNGRLGMSVYGTMPRDQILVNDDTLWSGCEGFYVNPKHYDQFRKAQKAAMEGRVKEANNIINEEMTGRWTEAYMPLGQVYLMHGQRDNFRNMQMKRTVEARESEFEGYRRSLNIEDAIETVSYKKDNIKIRKEYFVSKPADAGFMYVTAVDETGKNERPLSFAVGVDSKLMYENGADKESAFLTGIAPSHAEPSYTPVAPMLIYEKEEESKALRFALVVRVLDTDGACDTDGQRLYIKDATYAFLTIGAKTNFEGLDQPRNNNRAVLLNRLQESLKALSKSSYEEIRGEHIEDYRLLYDRVHIDLGTALTENLPTSKRLACCAHGVDDPALSVLYMQYARYLTIAGSRPGSQPLNLQGIWNDMVNAPWASNYTTNINVEMNYWPAEPLALPECHMPLMDMLEELSVNGKKVAEEYYHMNGWAVHHNVDLWRSGEPSCEDASWSWWPFGGTWMCQHIWTHYEFTQDKEFLERMLPVLEGNTLFMLDFLTEDAEGYLVTAPSLSPENKFIWNGGEETMISLIEEVASGSRCSPNHADISAVTVASTMDMSMIRELFINYIEGTRILGKNTEIADNAARALSKMRPYGIGSRGELLEWHDEEWECTPGMGHISHMYPVFPGELFTEHKNSELFKAAERSLERRQLNSSGGGGWPGAWRIALMARFKNALECGHLIKSCGIGLGANLVSAGSQQMDGIFGLAAGICEMLIQSHQGYIELIPSITVDWHKGSYSGLRARGGFEIAASWDGGKLQGARIISYAGNTARIKAAGLKAAVDENERRLAQTNEDYLEFETTAGKAYTLIFDTDRQTGRMIVPLTV